MANFAVTVKQIGNYEFDTSRCLGEGAFGKVFEGLDKRTKEKVAVKKLDLSLIERDKYLSSALCRLIRY